MKNSWGGRLLDTAIGAYEHRRRLVTEETFREVEKAVLLHTVDTCWQEHLYEMDELKEGVGFAGVAGKDPLLVYQKEAFEMFESLIARIDAESLRNLFQLRVDAGPPEARRAATVWTWLTSTRSSPWWRMSLAHSDGSTSWSITPGTVPPTDDC